MKQFISIPLIFAIFLTVSCRKDTIRHDRCETCEPTPPLTLATLYINDSNWVMQPDGTFTSDITALILQAGGTVQQLYTMEILSENAFYQIYPNYHVQLMGGTFYGSVRKYYDNEICTISFGDRIKYSGELPYGGLLPFRSILIRVLVTK
jgi:hypothetical protein